MRSPRSLLNESGADKKGEGGGRSLSGGGHRGGEGERGGVVMEALYDFMAEEEDEMSMTAGDHVIVVKPSCSLHRA